MCTDFALLRDFGDVLPPDTEIMDPLGLSVLNESKKNIISNSYVSDVKLIEITVVFL